MIYESRWEHVDAPDVEAAEVTLPENGFLKNGHGPIEHLIDDSHSSSEDQESRSDGQTMAPGRWLLFADESGVGHRLADKLRARNQECTVVRRGNSSTSRLGGESLIDPSCQAEVSQLVEEFIASDGPPIRGAVHLWSLDAPAADVTTQVLADWQDSSLISVLYLTQSWIESNATASQLWLVTRGVQPAGAEALSSSCAAQSPLIGLGRVIANEYPKFQCKLIDWQRMNRKPMLRCCLRSMPGRSRR